MSGQLVVTQITTLSGAKKSPKWSFKGRHDAKTTDKDNPGPGAYAQTDSGNTSKFHAGPKFNFGTSTRGGPADQGSSKDAPGPGEYSLKTTVGGSAAPAYSCTPRRELGSARRKDVPGPGTHSLPGLTGGSGTAHYGFGTADRQELSAVVSPGPAAYFESPPKKSEGPKWGIGTSQRNNVEGSKDTPGPGAYTLPNRAVDGPKYSAAPRREDMARTEGPGPSAYTLASSIGQGKKYTLRSRGGAASKNVDDPGPGAYDSNRGMGATKKKGANWVFGTSTRDGATGYQAPGPGAYTPRNPIAEVCPKYGFGSGQRGGAMQGNNQTPGPGAYDPDEEARPGPKYTCASRKHTVNKDTRPGPGAYDPAYDGHSHPPQWRFGTSHRQPSDSTSQKAPGPGTYAHGTTLIGPKFSIQSRRALKERVKITPGPGAHGGMVTQFGY